MLPRFGVMFGTTVSKNCSGFMLCYVVPANTPNYMINLETSIDPMFLSTLKFHFTYLNLSLNCDRVPRILANEVIKLNIAWVKECQLLCQSINFSPPNNRLLLLLERNLRYFETNKSNR